MNWDERGRLWVAETVDYPNELQPPGKGRDRIRICEDTDGDGRADKFTVFADKLSIPTSLIFARGGVIVQQAPETLFLQGHRRRRRGRRAARCCSPAGAPATRTPGRATCSTASTTGSTAWSATPAFSGDRRRRDSTSSARASTASSPDGSQARVPAQHEQQHLGPRLQRRGPALRLDGQRQPERLSCRSRIATTNGCAAGRRSVLGSIAARRPVLRRSPTRCGRSTDTAASRPPRATRCTRPAPIPSEYWNRTAFVCEPTGHLVGTFVLDADGARLSAAQRLEPAGQRRRMDRADRGRGRARRQRLGDRLVQLHRAAQPDAARLQDRQRQRLRDRPARQEAWPHLSRRLHARRSRPPLRSIKQLDADAGELVAALASDNLFWRLHAQRLLVERGNSGRRAELGRRWSQDDRSRRDRPESRGACTRCGRCTGLGVLDGCAAGRSRRAAIEALKHPSAGVRRNAVQVLPPDGRSRSAAIVAAGRRSNDADPQVRLAALLAAGRLAGRCNRRRPALIATVSDRRRICGDRWLPDAATGRRGCATTRRF